MDEWKKRVVDVFSFLIKKKNVRSNGPRALSEWFLNWIMFFRQAVQHPLCLCLVFGAASFFSLFVSSDSRKKGTGKPRRKEEEERVDKWERKSETTLPAVFFDEARNSDRFFASQQLLSIVWPGCLCFGVNTAMDVRFGFFLEQSSLVREACVSLQRTCTFCPTLLWKGNFYRANIEFFYEFSCCPNS